MAMKKILLLFAALFLCVGSAFAQDVIHTVDRRTIEAKVLEIGENYLIYKAFDNQGGPDYRMSLSRVTRIVFENGKEQRFNQYNPMAGSPYAYRYDPDFYPLDYHWGHYYGRHGRIYEENLADYIGVSLYGSDYMKAKSQYSWGFWLTTGGAALLLFSASGAIAMASSNAWAERNGMSSMSDGEFFIPTMIAGAAGLGVGIPLWVKGSKGLRRIADDYNANHGGDAYGSNPSLSIGPTGNGIGLALHF